MPDAGTMQGNQSLHPRSQGKHRELDEFIARVICKPQHAFGHYDERCSFTG